MTTAFRLILALPHLILVGSAVTWSIESLSALTLGSHTALSGAIAWLLAIINWFTIVLSGRRVGGIRELTRFVLQWRARAIAYSMLLVDDYPPFSLE